MSDSFATPWKVACQTLSVGFPRQEYWRRQWGQSTKPRVARLGVLVPLGRSPMVKPPCPRGVAGVQLSYRHSGKRATSRPSHLLHPECLPRPFRALPLTPRLWYLSGVKRSCSFTHSGHWQSAGRLDKGKNHTQNLSSRYTWSRRQGLCLIPLKSLLLQCQPSPLAQEVGGALSEGQ